MDKKTKNPDSRKKRGIFNSIFPQEYDFEEMLAYQADGTLAGVQILVQWLKKIPLEDPALLGKVERDVDETRHDMEEKLIKSFSTPFDRQDIYSLSRQMDYILNFSKETATEMYAFRVSPDKPITDMANALLWGTGSVVEGIKIMSSDKIRVEKKIREARNAIHELEDIYIVSMAALLHTNDAMNALRKREVYHHLRDAGRALRNTVDILHTVVVGLT